MHLLMQAQMYRGTGRAGAQTVWTQDSPDWCWIIRTLCGSKWRRYRTI